MQAKVSAEECTHYEDVFVVPQNVQVQTINDIGPSPQIRQVQPDEP